MTTAWQSHGRRFLGAALLTGMLVVPPTAGAQATDTTVAHPLRPISVSVTRAGTRSPLELPFALSRITPDSSRPALRKLNVGELLVALPGVQLQDRANPSQDPRLSIRGFGSRSAFGVRGVRVLRDGIPLSLPDGQTPLDWLDVESVGDVEVIRGTAAALFGNAAGGVVSFRSREPVPAPLAISTRAWSGGDLSRWSAVASHASPRTIGVLSDRSVLASFTRTAGEGYRAWSRQEATSLFVRSLATVAGTRLELQGTRYDSPRAENTGALTAEELALNPRLPDSLSVTRQSRKAAAQSQVALLATRSRGEHELTGSLFTSTRTLDNPLPFSIVGVSRRSTGGALRAGTRLHALPWNLQALRLTAGIDAQWQRDDRANWENCADEPPAGAPSMRCPIAGAERGAVRLDQREDVSGVGSYARAEVELPAQLFVSGALRHDRVRFDVRDRFVTQSNADDSGERTMNALSPMVGIVWRVRPLASLYVNWSNAFETPTITELTNQPDGAAGLNAVIAPQRTRTVETGVHGLFRSWLAADLALFAARVDDELISFDVPNAPGRRAFRNAGRTSRRGVEGSARVQLARTEIGAAYTWSKFRFVDYVLGETSFAGNAIPGIPTQQLQAFVTSRWRGTFATLESRMASEVAANDAGTVTAAGYAVWAVRGGFAPAPASWAARGEILFGVENLFDRRYASSVVTNATRGRYYEPGMGRNAYLGVRLDWSTR